MHSFPFIANRFHFPLKPVLSSPALHRQSPGAHIMLNCSRCWKKEPLQIYTCLMARRCLTSFHSKAFFSFTSYSLPPFLPQHTNKVFSVACACSSMFSLKHLPGYFSLISFFFSLSISSNEYFSPSFRAIARWWRGTVRKWHYFCLLCNYSWNLSSCLTQNQYMGKKNKKNSAVEGVLGIIWGFKISLIICIDK